MKLLKKKIIAVILLFSIICSVSFPYGSNVARAEVDKLDSYQNNMNYFIGDTYGQYLEKYKNVKSGNDVHVILADDYLEAAGEVTKVGDPNGDGKYSNAVYSGEESSISWKVTIKETGMYNILVDYLPAEGNNNDIERTISIDGEIPYKEAQFVTFSRVWVDAEKIKQDINGNDIKPKQIETPCWRSEDVYDASRYYNDALQFYLKEGTHVITIEAVREPMYIGCITIHRTRALSKYQEVKAEYDKNGYKPAHAEPVKIQAEDTYQKSNYTLYPSTDRTSPATEPQNTSAVKLNIISEDKFKLAGQWISWKINIPEDGLYTIALRYKQSLLSGIFTSRLLRIDGDIPFEEAKNLSFKYSSDWKVKALGNDEEDYMFYLTAGEHEISLEVTLGDLASVISQVNDSLTVLNEIYGKVLLIIGSEPDIYRDYNFKRQIPQTIKLMGEQAEAIKQISTQLEEIVGKKGEQTVILDKLQYQLSRMYEDPESIASYFTAFKDNIGNLASWVLTTSEQPLSIDYIYVAPVGEVLPSAEHGFFSNIWYEIKCFIMSFFVDYNSLGLTVSDEEMKETSTIEVWIMSGRDQANILRQMINDSFTPERNINIDLKLVSGETLLPSVLAGKGPDVALGNQIGIPIQYAVRNAVMSLNEFEGYQKVSERFHKSALVSYEFEGKVYAIPETQTFPMMFYRKDIFAELGLSVPQTWDDFYKVIAVLQRNNLEIGFPQGLPGMQIFLYQNGGSLYNSTLSASTLNEDLTVDAFQKMIDLFTTYKFPRDYNFANRFRTGLMPLAIQDYTEYNTLVAFAPEIKGLWSFAPIPGTVGEDGITRAAACNGTCAMILSGAKDPDASWKFLEWWTSTDIQAQFAQEMKSVLGKSAMHATANMEAIRSLPWTKEEYSNLLEQWGYITGTPEIPGGYYVPRNVGFAANVAYGTGEGEVLMDYSKETNEEITRKRAEFGLE
jgi:ABC-type glycerol-3-phosphate transport system substrate-binding protein